MSESKEGGRQPDKPEVEMVLLGYPKNAPANYIPNTILLSIVKNAGQPFCNVEFKRALDYKGIVISIGSACLTSQQQASHVLRAINAPQKVKEGTVRISLGDYNTMDECVKFCKVFLDVLEKQLKKLA